MVAVQELGDLGTGKSDDMEFLTLYNYGIIILLLPLIALAFFSIKFARNGWSRITMLLLFVLAVAVGFVIPNEFTSYPKPVALEWMDRDLTEAQVLWSHIDPETEQMYLLLFWKNEPRLYKPIWDWDIARELAEAKMKSEMAKAKGGNGEITMAYPFLDKEERQKRMRGDAQEYDAESDSSRELFRQDGFEEENDSDVFHVAPPPYIPEKDPPKSTLRT